MGPQQSLSAGFPRGMDLLNRQSLNKGCGSPFHD
jgi:hypothetical protein